MTYIFLMAAVVLLITLWRREYGLGAVILLWPSYVLRTTISDIPTTALELSIYALAAGWLVRSIISRDFIRPKLPRWMMVLTGLWVVAWILSTALSTDHQASLGAFKAWLVDPLLFGFVLLSVVRTAPQRTIIFSAVALSGTVVAIAGLAQLVWFRDTLQDNRLSSFFHPVANYAAMYLGPVLVLTVGWLLWKQLHRGWWIVAGIMAVALALTVSFGGYLAVGVGAVFFWWRWPNTKVKLTVLLAGVIVAALGVLVLSRTSYLSEKFKTTDRSSSLVRSQIWRTSIEMIKDHPLFGVGPNAYEKVYRATIPKLYFPPLEWLVSQPHQLYLALWLETGLLGLLTFLMFIVLWFKALWKRVQSGDGITITAVAVMLAVLAHGFVDTPLFKNDLVMIFIFLMVLPWLRADTSTK